MTVPTISNLPTVPATSDPNFETEAPALFNHIKNTFVSEMNSAISFINSSTFDATVEFKNANFTAARNFLYMIDTSSGGVSVTLPANPSTGDQLLLMDQKRSFGTNNLTIGRNSQNINGAASDVVSKSTGALIRCIFQASYGWTVDLYEGEWESGTNAGDLVYNGGNVGIGTSSPATKLNIFDANPVIQQTYRTARTDANEYIAGGLESYFVTRDGNTNLGAYIYVKDKNTNSSFPTTIRGGEISIGTVNGSSGSFSDAVERLRIDADGKVGIGTSLPQEKLDLYGNLKLGSNGNDAIIKAWTSRGTDEGGNTTSGSNLILKAGIGTGAASGANGQIEFHTESSLAVINNGAPHGSGSAKMVIKSTGKVGIGTSAPYSSLTVRGTGNSINLDLNSTTTGSNSSIVWNGSTIDSNPNYSVAITGYREGSGAAGALGLKTRNGTSGNLEERMRIDSSGNVGIGTSEPKTELQIHNPANAASYSKFTNVNTGATATDGTTVGISTAGDFQIWNWENSEVQIATNNTQRLTIDSSGNVEVKTGNLVIGTAGKGIDFGVASGSVTSQLLDDYEEGTFTPAFIDTNGDATFTHDIQKGRYTKVGDCVYFSLTIGTDSVTAGTGDLKISGLPFTAQNAESQIKPSGAVGINYSWGTSPTHWLVNANSDAVILYKSVNPLTASKSADCGTTVDDNRLFMHGFYFV